MVVLGSLPAVDSCLSDRHVSLESHPHIPEPLSVVTTEGDRKRAKKKIGERGIGREDTQRERERERERRVKNVCCLSQSGAFLPWLLIGSSVLSVCPRLFEEGLELTHTLSAASINGAFYGLWIKPHIQEHPWPMHGELLYNNTVWSHTHTHTHTLALYRLKATECLLQGCLSLSLPASLSLSLSLSQCVIMGGMHTVAIFGAGGIC